MITVVLTMRGKAHHQWNDLLTTLTYHYGRKQPVDIELLIEQGEARLLATLPGKVEWVKGIDDFIFDGLKERRVLALYEPRGIETETIAPEMDPIETKYQDMEQLLQEE